MKSAKIFMHGKPAGILTQTARNHFIFQYLENYLGPPISLTMPVSKHLFEYNQFPPFFDGLLPEGMLLDALLRKYKLDKDDYMSQLIQVGGDVVGAVTIEVNDEALPHHL